MSLFSRIKEFFTPTAIPSELSDPTVNKPPYGFYRGNYETLAKVVYHSGFGTPEYTPKKLASMEQGFFGRIEEVQEIIIGQYRRRMGELARMGYLDVRKEKMDKGYRNHFKINQKGRKMYLKYKSYYEKKAH